MASIKFREVPQDGISEIDFLSYTYVLTIVGGFKFQQIRQIAKLKSLTKVSHWVTANHAKLQYLLRFIFHLPLHGRESSSKRVHLTVYPIHLRGYMGK